MAEKFQPVLSPSSAQPFIAPAVRDTGLAESIASFGKLGVAAYTGYQTAQQDKGYEADINAYLQSQGEADSRKDIFEMDLANKVKTEDEMWNAAGAIPKHIGLGGDGMEEFPNSAPGGRMVEAGDIDQVQQGMSRTLEKFLQAQRQGRMTIGELEARIMDTTRRAISRNPFLQDELLRAGQKYMDISGASAYMKSQLKIEKSKADQQEEVYKQHVAWASKYGIPMTRRNWMGEAAQAAVLEGEHARKVSYMDEAIKRRAIKQNELSDIVNDPTIRQQHMAGEMLKFKTTYTRLNGLAQFSTNDKVLAMSNEIDSSINFLESISAQLPSGSSGAIGGQIALLNKQKELYKDLLEGGPNAKAAKNGLDLAESLAKLPYVRDEVKLSMLQKGTSAMFNIAQASGQIPLSQDRAAELMQAVDMMIPTGASSPLAIVNLGTPDGKYQASAVFAMLDPEKVENARDVNSATISTALKHIATIPDGNQSAQLSDVLFEQIISQSRATGKPITALLNDTALSEMNRYITGLMGNARNDGGKVDYNPNTNTFSYLDSTGNINQAGSDRANKMFKTLLLVNGFGDEATIDKWGAFFAGKGAAPSQPKPTSSEKALGEKLSGLTPEVPNLASIIKLEQEIAKATNPKVKAILVAEHNRIKDQIISLQSPTQSTPASREERLATLKRQVSLMGDSEAKRHKEVEIKLLETSLGKKRAPKTNEMAPQPTKAEPTSKESPGAQFGTNIFTKPEKVGEPPVEKPQVDRTHIKQAEQEIVGESWTKAPLKHTANQEAIMKRAAALASGKDVGIYISNDRERIVASPKGKWVIYKELPNGKTRMYSPVEKVYVDVTKKDIPQLEAWFKLPKTEWKKWEK